jgi:hypothetical protein
MCSIQSTSHEEKVIKMRFGLEDGSEHILEESRPVVRSNPRTLPPDRSQGATKVASSIAFAKGCGHLWMESETSSAHVGTGL